MANIRYTVQCPSCEADVLITSSAKVGKKIDCPKCKYRFTVPAPADDGDDDAPKKKSNKKTAKKKNNSGLIYAGVGVLALILLGIAGYVIFGTGESNSGGGTTTPPTSTTTPTTPAAKNNSDGGSDSGSEGNATPGEGTPPMGEATEGDKPKVKDIVGTGGKLKDVTNLLPGETTAVYRINFDRFNTNCTPLATAMLDSKIRDLFRNSMTFGTEQLAVYIHCIVGPDRDAFGVIRTKEPVNESALYADLQLEEVENGVRNGKKFFRLKNNAFIDAVSLAFTTQTITKLIGLDFPPPTQKELEEKAKKKYAFCAYDRQTLLIGDMLIMERYLEDLQQNGYPPFKSEMTADTAPEAVPSPGGTEGGSGGPAGGPGRGAPRGGDGRSFSTWPESNSSRAVNFVQGPPVPGEASVGIPGQPQPGGPNGPGGAGGTAAPRRRLFTSIPTYRTIDPPLKKMLNELEEDTSANGPALIYAERLDQRIFNGRAALQAYQQTGDAVFALLSRVQMIGASFSLLTKDKLSAKVSLDFVSDEDAKKTAVEIIEPNLKIFAPIIDIFMGSLTTVKSSVASNGGGSGPGGVPNGLGGRGGDSDEGGLSPGAPPSAPTGGGPPSAGGSGGDLNNSNALFASSMDISVSDRLLTVDIAMKWQEEKFNTFLQPQIARFTGMLKGRMSVLTGEIEWHRLAAVSNKIQSNKKLFPTGTLPREASDTRYRLPYPPDQQVSFFAELLPFIGQGPLRAQIQDRKKAWYDKENIGAAEAWVPEFLVPYYPQETWRALNSRVPGKQLGATNYVAPAGLGLDSGRYDPANPDHAKKVGITGYNWGSKVEDVKDGLANTIYLVQAAPGVARPWIVGGGSTVVGINDNGDPMAPFIHKTADGTRGTYVLMADGSVRFLKEGMDAKLFRGMVTRAGGETLTDLDGIAKKIPATKPIETELRGGPAIGAKDGKKPTAEAVNPDDLKPLQGTWKATYLKLPQMEKKVPAEVRDQVIYVVKFDGNIIRLTATFEGKSTESPGMEIVKLDPKAKPAIIDIKNDKGVIEPSIYELKGNKLKIRSNEKTRPTKIGVPEAGSTDSYLELEKVE